MSIRCKYLLRATNRRACVRVLCFLLPILSSPLAIAPGKESRCVFVMLLMAAYWIMEPVHVAVTSLLPVVLFPLLGILSSTEVCSNYIKEFVITFLGSLIVAIAVEECHLHERIALKVLLLIGTEIKWLMLGFMMTTMFLSMWISNTGSTAMMIPIVDAVVTEMYRNDTHKEEIKEDSFTESKKSEYSEEGDNSTRISIEENESNKPGFSVRVVLLLCVAYSASLGGTGTLTGCVVNLLSKGLIDEIYPKNGEITFITWMMYNIPGMLLCVLVGWFYLWFVHIRCTKKSQGQESSENIREEITKRYSELGSWTCHEVEVLVLFLILVSLWLFRDPKFIIGWADALGFGKNVKDSVPSMAVSFLLFMLPSDIRDLKSRPILSWKTAQAKLPWGVFLLIGGSLSLGNAIQKSGLSKVIELKLSSLVVLSPGAMVVITCILTIMITEIFSNLLTVVILLPLLSQLALLVGVNPLYFMLPTCVMTSYAFMLPVATAPNAMVFDAGNMRTMDMAIPGLGINVICCAIQLLMINTLGVAMFDLNTFPSWAFVNETSSNHSALEALQNRTFLEVSTAYQLSYSNDTLNF